MDKLAYDFSEYAGIHVDSVRLIGFTDSVGSSKNNYKLAEKRMGSVRQLLENELQISILNINSQVVGELSSGSDSLNRRVDVLIFTTDFKEEIASPDLKNKPNINCVYLEYQILQSSIQVVTTVKKKKVVELTCHDGDLIEGKVMYYGTLNSEDVLTPKKLKWKKKQTGMLWWSRMRYVSYVPYDSFKKWRIFNYSENPCVDCGSQLEVNTIKVDSCIQTDRVLMDNFHYKSKWFQNGEVLVRVPKEFVDSSATYFIGCANDQIVDWKTKSGKKNQKYLYTGLPLLAQGVYGNITKKVECCLKDTSSRTCDSEIFRCGYLSEPTPNWKFSLETGYLNSKANQLFYAQAGVLKHIRRFDFSLMFGSSFKGEFLTNLRVKYALVDFLLEDISPVSKWKSPKKDPLINHHFNIYVGTEILGLDLTNDVGLCNNWFTGVRWLNCKENGFMNEVYLQSGLSFDKTGSSQIKFSPFLKTGISVNLIHFWN